jgi:hypothetical protein
VIGLVTIASLSIAGVATAAVASDPRADFHDGNVTTCDDVGFGDSTQVGATGNSSAADAFVSGVVKPNAGTIQPGTGEELDVTLLKPGVVIDAVVVKGADGYNVYSDPAVLPPTLPPDQHYIAPLTGNVEGAGNVPAISHWFVCYTAPDTGSLQVTKTVVFTGTGTPPAVPPSFTVHVVCNDGTDVTLPFAPGAPAIVTDIVAGSVCVVTETTVLSGGGTKAYNPTTASSTGVTIIEDEQVTVAVTNSFPNVAAAVAVVVPAKFTG